MFQLDKQFQLKMKEGIMCDPNEYVQPVGTSGPNPCLTIQIPKRFN